MADQPPQPPPPPPPVQFGSVEVIGSQYMVPYNVDLIVTQKFLSLSQGDYTITDINGQEMFKFKGELMSLRNRRVLVDSAGKPIVTLKMKFMSAHSRWLAFRGDSSDEKDFLFTVKRSSILQFKPKLEVFLAGNEKEENCDFKIQGSWSERYCSIYLGDSSTIIAQMCKKNKFGNMILGKDMFGVTVYPNVDYAFVVALIVVLDGINEESGSAVYA